MKSRRCSTVSGNTNLLGLADGAKKLYYLIDTPLLSPSELNDIDSEDEDTKDYDSDEDLQIDEEEAGGSGPKKERYFWQYNVQAKGPKGQVGSPFRNSRTINCRNFPWTQPSKTPTS